MLKTIENIMENKSKYTRVEGWDDSEGFLTPQQIQVLVQAEKNLDVEDISLSNGDREYLLTLEAKKVDRSKLRFSSEKPEHPLGKDGLERAYGNLKVIEINPDDLDSIN